MLVNAAGEVCTSDPAGLRKLCASAAPRPWSVPVEAAHAGGSGRLEPWPAAPARRKKSLAREMNYVSPVLMNFGLEWPGSQQGTEASDAEWH